MVYQYKIILIYNWREWVLYKYFKKKLKLIMVKIEIYSEIKVLFKYNESKKIIINKMKGMQVKNKNSNCE